LIPLHDPDLIRRRTPYVTIAIIAVNVLVSVTTLLFLSDLRELEAIYRFGAIPGVLTGGEGFGVVQVAPRVTVDLTSPLPAVMTIFTSMFMHAGWMHLSGNMVYLWVFGDNIEDRLGHMRYLLFYLAAGAIAVGAHVASGPGSGVPMIGASGAVAGVLGGYIVLHPKSRITTLIIMGFIFSVRLPALLLLGGWMVFQVFFGAASLAVTDDGGGVAYFAHVGGFAAGAATFAVLRASRSTSADSQPRLF
jgi:membrane associated rhomboid family serine protease